MEHFRSHQLMQSRRNRRRRAISAAAVLTAVLVGGLALGVAGGGATAIAAEAVPFTDPNATGSIGLCDQAGQPLTHGRITDKPLAWKAVGATAAKAPYNVSGATATLYAFQPRQGVDPGGWSGEQLSASSRFTDPAHPTAALTGLDDSLAVFVADFPPQWDGFVELRIYLGAPNEPPFKQTYDVANLAISGATWKTVGASPVSCGSGSAVSLEQVLATSSAIAASLAAKTTEAPGATAQRAGVSPAQPGRSTAPSNPSRSDTSPASSASGPGSDSLEAAKAAGAVDAAAPAGTSGSLGTPFWILVGLAVVGVGFLCVQWLRSKS